MCRSRTAAQNPKWPVADLVAVAIWAMQHVSSPSFSHTRNVWQIVSEPGRDEDSPSGERDAAIQHNIEAGGGGLQSDDGRGDDLRTIPQHLGSPNR
jgi:hypothetical protein